MTTLVVGASAGVGRALGRRLAKAGHDLILAARDAADLEAEAAHLRTTTGVNVEWITLDGASPSTVEERVRPLAERGDIQNLFFPVAMAAPTDKGTLPAGAAAAIVNANLTSIAVIVSQLLPAVLRANSGNIVGFGSVTAVRGRRSNIVYAASKRGLESYFESLRHLLSNTGVHVQFYRLGYVDTQLSYGRAMRLPVTSPDRVAEHVVKRLGRDVGQPLYPVFWACVAALVRITPWPIFRRLDF